jgi:ferredoxin
MAGLYFHAEFVALAAEHDWFHYHPRITGDDSDWRGLKGRLCGTDVLASSAPQSVFMLCAGRAMEVELTTALTALGVPAARIHRENFGLGAPSCEVEGTVSCAGRSFPIGRAASLLEVLERNRVPISAECRVGECGHCEIELAEGTVRNLMNSELQTGTVLACTVVPVGSIALRLRS